MRKNVKFSNIIDIVYFSKNDPPNLIINQRKGKELSINKKIKKIYSNLYLYLFLFIMLLIIIIFFYRIG